MSDASNYRLAAGAILKSLSPKLFYVTDVAHLLHNCAMKIKSDLEDVDQLIVRIKFATVKNRALELELERGAGAPEPGFFRGAGAGAGALYEIQVELEPVV